MGLLWSSDFSAALASSERLIYTAYRFGQDSFLYGLTLLNGSVAQFNNLYFLNSSSLLL